MSAVAPALEGVDERTERLYRIASNDRSSVTYASRRPWPGHHDRRGHDHGVAGDIAVNTADPAASRVGRS